MGFSTASEDDQVLTISFTNHLKFYVITYTLTLYWLQIDSKLHGPIYVKDEN